IKVLDEAVRSDFCHADNFAVDHRHERVFLSQPIRPLTHVLIARSPTLDQLRVIIASDGLTCGGEIHAPDCFFLAAIIASDFHGSFSANDERGHAGPMMLGKEKRALPALADAPGYLSFRQPF